MPSSQSDKLFLRLSGVQLTELAIRLQANLPANSPTQIAVSISVGHGKVGERPALVATLELKATSGKVSESDESPILTALCRVSGAWTTVDAPEKVGKDEIGQAAQTQALPILFPLARQHLSDILAKGGVNVTAWPWSVEAVESQSTPIPSPGTTVESPDKVPSVTSKPKKHK